MQTSVFYNSGSNFFDRYRRRIYKFDIMFVGDDWAKTEKWNGIEQKFDEVGVEIVYFPYTKSTSSSLINETLLRLREGS